MTQSALSHQLKDLEIQLGFKVFYRARNKWELTEEGSVLYKTACTVIDSIGNGLNEIQQIRAGAAGTIKSVQNVTHSIRDCRYLFRKMKVLYPEIEVDLVLEATHKPVEKNHIQ